MRIIYEFFSGWRFSVSCIVLIRQRRRWWLLRKFIGFDHWCFFRLLCGVLCCMWVRGGGRDFTAPCHVSLEMTRRFDCEFSFFPIKYPRVRYHGPLSEEEDKSFPKKKKSSSFWIWGALSPRFFNGSMLSERGKKGFYRALPCEPSKRNAPQFWIFVCSNSCREVDSWMTSSTARLACRWFVGWEGVLSSPCSLYSLEICQHIFGTFHWILGDKRSTDDMDVRVELLRFLMFSWLWQLKWRDLLKRGDASWRCYRSCFRWI